MAVLVAVLACGLVAVEVAVSMAVEAVRSITDSLQSGERWEYRADSVVMANSAQTSGSYGTTNVIALKAAIQALTCQRT